MSNLNKTKKIVKKLRNETTKIHNFVLSSVRIDTPNIHISRYIRKPSITNWK